MVDWIPQTKLRPPRVGQNLIQRHELIDKLHQAVLQKRLALLSSPSGYGKTTLMASLLEAHPDLPAVWLSLDEQDNSPAAFLSALIAAFQRLNPGLGEEAVQVLAEQAAGQIAGQIAFAEGSNADANSALNHRPANLLIRSVIDHLSGYLLIILDDLHTLQDPAVFAILDLLLERMPPDIHFLIGSRYDLPLALARLRSRSELAEFRPDQLRFSLAETASLLNEQLRLSLSGEDMHILHALTEGWAAGLQLAAGTLQHLAPFTDRAVFLKGLRQATPQMFDLLADEVFNYQEPEIQTFLMETSILPELTVEACEAISGRKDSMAVLEIIYRRNLFLSILDSMPEDRVNILAEAAAASHRAYQYHALFAAFLQHQLRKSGEDRWREVNARAAAVQRFPARALAHFMEARLFEAAANLLEKEGEALLRQGYLPSLATWIAALPQEIFNERPKLSFLFGQVAFYRQDLPSAAGAYDCALRGFQDLGDMEGVGKVITAQVGLAFLKSDFKAGFDLIRQALECPLSAPARIQLLLERARIAQFTGDFSQAEIDFEAADGILQETDQLDAWYTFFDGLTPGILAIKGWLEKAGKRIEQAEILFRAREQAGNLAALEREVFQVVIEEQRAVVSFYRGEIDVALDSANRALELGRRTGGRPTWQHWVTEIMALSAERILHQQPAAQERMQRLAGEARQMVQANRKSLHVLSGMLYILGHALWLDGKYPEVMHLHMLVNDLAQRQIGLITQCSQVMFHGLVHLGNRLETWDEARDLFQKAAEIETRLPLFNFFGSARLLLAECYRRNGQVEEARRQAEAALAECQAQRAPGRILLEEEVALNNLRLIQSGPQQKLAKHLIRQLEPEQPVVQVSFRVPETGESLTAREIEVLELLAEGATNQQIADRLVLSLHTVKHHVASLLGKLGVKNRSQAAHRARELQIPRTAASHKP